MDDTDITLSDGRTLAYVDLGDRAGVCTLFFHGAPMSRLHLAAMDAAFAARGLRVVSPDRPGYGGSSPQPGRTLADWPADAAALADALGVERFLVAGHSSGGPYAVACAALLPERVAGTAVFAGVTDMGWPNAWQRFTADEVQMMRQPDEQAAVDWAVTRYGADGRGFFEADPFEFPDVDLALLEAEDLQRAVTEGFRQGVEGYARDVFVQGQPWTFDPGRISAPVEVLHGSLDAVVPVAHSWHTADRIEVSQLHIVSGHGHLSVLSELPAILERLAAEGR